MLIALQKAVERDAAALMLLLNPLTFDESSEGAETSEVMAKPLGSYRGPDPHIILKPRTEAGVGVGGWQWYTASRVSDASAASREGEGDLGELLRGDSRAGQVYYLYSLVQLSSRPCCTTALPA